MSFTFSEINLACSARVMAWHLTMVLWAVHFTITLCASTLNHSNAIVASNGAVDATDVSSTPFVWSLLGDSWAVSSIRFYQAHTANYDIERGVLQSAWTYRCRRKQR
jgi:NADH:ubiquinone oxidoreductase subunit B-like Fe-S oxidoreductase